MARLKLCDEDAHLSHAVGKQEAHIVAHLPDERHSLQVVFLLLTAEACDEVTAEAHTWPGDEWIHI